jgi:hypothetical protein
VRHRGLLIYISINIQPTNPNSLNTQSTPIFSIPNDNNILSPFNDVTSNWTNFIVSIFTESDTIRPTDLAFRGSNHQKKG